MFVVVLSIPINFFVQGVLQSKQAKNYLNFITLKLFNKRPFKLFPQAQMLIRVRITTHTQGQVRERRQENIKFKRQHKSHKTNY